MSQLAFLSFQEPYIISLMRSPLPSSLHSRNSPFLLLLEFADYNLGFLKVFLSFPLPILHLSKKVNVISILWLISPKFQGSSIHTSTIVLPSSSSFCMFSSSDRHLPLHNAFFVKLLLLSLCPSLSSHHICFVLFYTKQTKGLL